MSWRLRPLDTSTETLIYIGPTLTARGLTQFTVYRGSLPDYVSGLMREHPCLRALVVPVGRLVQARRGLTQKGSLQHMMYERALAELRNNPKEA